MLVKQKLFIDGKWVAPSGREAIDVHNAGSGEIMGRIPAGDEKDADRQPYPAQPPSHRIFAVFRHGLCLVRH